MNKKNFTLCDLNIGECGEVIKIETDGSERRRFLDLGMVEGTNITSLYKSPAKDPIAYYIRGAVIALRTEDAKKIIIKRGDNNEKNI